MINWLTILESWKKNKKNPEKKLKKQIRRCLNVIIFGVDISSSIYTDNR